MGDLTASIQIANVLVMRDFMDRWPITPLQKGFMSEFLFLFDDLIRIQLKEKTWGNKAAVLELGALMGALIAGFYADRYSRRHSIVIACGTCLLHGHGGSRGDPSTELS